MATSSATTTTIDYERRAAFHVGEAAEYERLAALARENGLPSVAAVYAEYAARERAAARREREWGNREAGDGEEGGAHGG